MMSDPQEINICATKFQRWYFGRIAELYSGEISEVLAVLSDIFCLLKQAREKASSLLQLKKEDQEIPSRVSKFADICISNIDGWCQHVPICIDYSFVNYLSISLSKGIAQLLQQVVALKIDKIKASAGKTLRQLKSILEIFPKIIKELESSFSQCSFPLQHLEALKQEVGVPLTAFLDLVKEAETAAAARRSAAAAAAAAEGDGADGTAAASAAAEGGAAGGGASWAEGGDEGAGAALAAASGREEAEAAVRRLCRQPAVVDALRLEQEAAATGAQLAAALRPWADLARALDRRRALRLRDDAVSGGGGGAHRRAAPAGEEVGPGESSSTGYINAEGQISRADAESVHAVLGLLASPNPLLFARLVTAPGGPARLGRALQAARACHRRGLFAASHRAMPEGLGAALAAGDPALGAALAEDWAAARARVAAAARAPGFAAARAALARARAAARAAAARAEAALAAHQAATARHTAAAAALRRARAACAAAAARELGGPPAPRGRCFRRRPVVVALAPPPAAAALLGL